MTAMIALTEQSNGSILFSNTPTFPHDCYDTFVTFLLITDILVLMVPKPKNYYQQGTKNTQGSLESCTRSTPIILSHIIALDDDGIPCLCHFVQLKKWTSMDVCHFCARRILEGERESVNRCTTRQYY